jgi:hypothetical protein
MSESSLLDCGLYMGERRGGFVDGLADAQVGAAAAEIAAHGFIDVAVCGYWMFGEQSGSRHDLPGLTVAALRDIDLKPGLLQGVGVIGREAFERSDVGVGCVGEPGQAGACGVAVKVNGAGATLADAAAILGGVEVEHVADNPEKRSVGGRVDSGGAAVEGQSGRHTLNSKDTPAGAA